MRRWIVPAVLCGNAVVGLGLTAWAMAVWKPTDSGHVASWVQAIGSIVAIVAAAGGVQWAHSLASRSAAESAANDEVRKLAAIASCIFHCRAETESLKRYSAYKPDISEHVESLSKHVNMLQAINLLDIPDWRAAVAVGQALAMYSYLRSRLLTSEPIAVLNQMKLDNRVAYCKDAILKFGQCEELLRATLKDRTSDVPMQQVAYADGAVLSLSAMEIEVPAGKLTL